MEGETRVAPTGLSCAEVSNDNATVSTAPQNSNRNHDDVASANTPSKKRPRRAAAVAASTAISGIDIDENENENENENVIDENENGIDENDNIDDPRKTSLDGHGQDVHMSEEEETEPGQAETETEVEIESIMGVSLPWFERGGPVYERPRSLLWDTPDNQNDLHGNWNGKRKRAATTVPTTSTATPSCFSVPRPIHFAGLPIPSKILGVCAECGISYENDNDNDNDNPDGNDNGDNTEESDNGNGNVIVLCDGPGCDREFHLKCCRPPLQQIPEDEFFYCFDCHPHGGYATSLLEDYLNETEYNRESHNEELSLWEQDHPANNSSSSSMNIGIDKNKDNDDDKYKALTATTTQSPGPPLSATTPTTPSRRTRRITRDTVAPIVNGSSSNNNNNINATTRKKSSGGISSRFTFVDKLLFDDMEENQPEMLLQVMNGICADAVGKGPPQSELKALHRKKPRVRVRTRRWASQAKAYVDDHDENNDDDDDDDDLLVGCALRLYCPKTNHYHTGRILRIREPPDNRDPNNVVVEDYDRNHDTECLVRFQAGRDFRKKSLTRWIRLEEHSLAVACPDLVWGKFDASELEQHSNLASNSKKAKSKKKKKSASPSSSKHRWVPTKLWMRSSRELVMSMKLLEESLGQIGYRGFRYSDAASPASIISTASTAALVNGRSQRSSPRKSSSSLLSFPLNSTKNDKSHKQDSNTEAALTINASKSLSNDNKSYLQQEWILAECIGRGIYKLVHVSTETKEYIGGGYDSSNGSAGGSPVPKTTTNKNQGKHRKASPKKSSDIFTRPREHEIMVALVQAEREERKRVRLWNQLPLENAWHEKALTGLDECALGPLAYDGAYNNNNNNRETCGEEDHCDESENENEDGHCYKKSVSIQPTPLVRTGLDRMYILKQFVAHMNQKLEDHGAVTNTVNVDANANANGSAYGLLQGTKDLAMSLSSDLISNHSITACIQQQNRMARMRQSEERNRERQTELRQTEIEPELELSEGSPSSPVPNAKEENKAAIPEVETDTSMEELHNDQNSKTKTTPEESAIEITPENVEVKTVVPNEASKNTAMAQNTPLEGETDTSMQDLHDDQNSKTKTTPEESAIETPPEDVEVQTIVPNEAPKNTVMAQNTPLEGETDTSMQDLHDDQNSKTETTPDESAIETPPEDVEVEMIVPSEASKNTVMAQNTPLEGETNMSMQDLHNDQNSKTEITPEESAIETPPEDVEVEMIVPSEASKNTVMAQNTPPEGETNMSMQDLHNDQNSKTEITPEESAIETPPENVEVKTIVLNEASKNTVMAQNTPPEGEIDTSKQELHDDQNSKTTLEESAIETTPENVEVETIVLNEASKNTVMAQNMPPEGEIDTSMQELHNDQNSKNTPEELAIETTPENVEVEKIVLNEASKNTVIAQNMPPEGETNSSMQELHNDQNLKTTPEESAIETTPENVEVETIVPNEASNNTVMAPNTPQPRRSQSPTSSTGIPLLVRNENETKTTTSGLLEEAVSVPSSQVETSTLAFPKETTPSNTVAPSVPAPEIMLSKESTSAVSTSVPTPS